MALAHRLAAAAVNRTPINAPTASAAVRRLFETSNNARARRGATFLPAWAVGAKRRSDGSLLSTTYVNVGPSTTFQIRLSSSSVMVDSSKTTIIPDFSGYKKSASGKYSSRAFAYMMVGAMGAVTAAGTKMLVTDFLSNMAASADVLALAKVEVDLGKIPEGRNVTIKWRGKPVFIRHRTPQEIAEANSVNISELKDPQPDSARVQRPEWLIMLGVCTHLGCVPVGEMGDFGGWFCPCHGSHYDISGRIRKGPAPLNLEIPEYNFQTDDLLVLG